MILVPARIDAQGNAGELILSVKEAQEYALMNNKIVLAARSDVQASKAALWETI